MTARRPAGALLHAQGVVRTAETDGPALDLLEMTLEAQIRIARVQQLGVDRA